MYSKDFNSGASTGHTYYQVITDKIIVIIANRSNTHIVKRQNYLCCIPDAGLMILAFAHAYFHKRSFFFCVFNSFTPFFLLRLGQTQMTVTGHISLCRVSSCQFIVDSNNPFSLRYSMPIFSANLFGIFSNVSCIIFQIFRPAK